MSPHTLTIVHIAMLCFAWLIPFVVLLCCFPPPALRDWSVRNAKYVWYLLQHKYWVFRCGLLLKVPIWQLVVHDWSKFLLSEWTPYSKYFYVMSKPALEEGKEAFTIAWMKHIHRQPHHWEHWCEVKLAHPEPHPIPERFVREMVADWMAAGRTINGHFETVKWYAGTGPKMVLHPDTRHRVSMLLLEFAEPVEGQKNLKGNSK